MTAEAFALAPQSLTALRKRGFESADAGFRRDGLTFVASGRWLVLTQLGKRRGRERSPVGPGQPGLWKAVGDPADRHVFEIPAWVVSDTEPDDGLDESGPVPLLRLLDWALATRRGSLPRGWTPPAAELVNSWLARGALTVRSKGYVRQGELVLQPDRWALRMPILAKRLDGLPQPRADALQRVVQQAQNTWAMVRFRPAASEQGPGLTAEVDLSGAPHSQVLFSAGLEVLRHLVSWLIEIAEVLADPTVALATLASCEDNKIIQVERKT